MTVTAIHLRVHDETRRQALCRARHMHPFNCFSQPPDGTATLITLFGMGKPRLGEVDDLFGSQSRICLASSLRACVLPSTKIKTESKANGGDSSSPKFVKMPKVRTRKMTVIFVAAFPTPTDFRFGRCHVTHSGFSLSILC